MVSTTTSSSLLKFENSIIESKLPIDENPTNEQRAIRGFNFSKVTPTPLDEPRLAIASDEVMAMIGLNNYKAVD